jgi:hypothetical protein
MGVPNDRDTNAKLTPSGKNSGTKDTSPGVPLEVANTWCTRGGLIRRCQYRVSQHNDYCSRESARYHRGISSRGTASAARKEVLDEVEGPNSTMQRRFESYAFDRRSRLDFYANGGEFASCARTHLGRRPHRRLELPFSLRFRDGSLLR